MTEQKQRRKPRKRTDEFKQQLLKMENDILHQRRALARQAAPIDWVMRKGTKIILRSWQHVF